MAESQIEGACRSPPRAPPYWKQAPGDEGEREASPLGGGESLASIAPAMIKQD
jgi:hypothetical protein